jgi:hypothetical protein
MTIIDNVKCRLQLYTYTYKYVKKVSLNVMIIFNYVNHNKITNNVFSWYGAFFSDECC